MKVKFVTLYTNFTTNQVELAGWMNDNNAECAAKAESIGFEVVNQSFHLMSHKSASGEVFAAIQLFKLVKQTVVDGDETLEEADN